VTNSKVICTIRRNGTWSVFCSKHLKKSYRKSKDTYCLFDDDFPKERCDWPCCEKMGEYEYYPNARLFQ
jgi:hypothetical protein